MHVTGRYAGRLGLLTVATALAWPLAAITPALGATPAAAHQPAARAAAGAGRMIPAVGHPLRFRNTGFRARHLRPDLVIPCESNTATVKCYEPRQIRMAYNVPGGLTGAGRSITIIDAFQSPTIGADLAAFSKLFNLASPKLRIIAPQGLTPFNSKDPDQVGWAGEISLDVEWAHAIAPGATINLVLARSDQDKDIFAAQRYVIRHNLGDVLSQSFGEAERCMRPRVLKGTHELFKEAAAERMTVFASSGDFGSAQPSCNGSSFTEAASSPASDPRVTGVGGTHLQAGFPDGDYEGETAWNDSIGSSGGGYSVTYSRPRFQRGFGRPSTAACLTCPTTRRSTAACWSCGAPAARAPGRSSWSAGPARAHRSGQASWPWPTRPRTGGSATSTPRCTRSAARPATTPCSTTSPRAPTSGARPG